MHLYFCICFLVQTLLKSKMFKGKKFPGELVSPEEYVFIKSFP